MNVKAGLLWQAIKKHPFITVGTITSLVIVSFILAAYTLGWYWTGITSAKSQIIITTTSTGTFTANEVQPAKTLWDWLGLLAALAIPIVVGLGTVWFTQLQQQRDRQLSEQRTIDERNAAEEQAKNEQRIALDNQREVALQDYIDHMSELLLEKKLGDADEDEVVRKIARVRTLTVLRNLDPARKASILSFLYDSGLIHKGIAGGILNLKGADFSLADIGSANLSADSRVSLRWMRVHSLYGDLQKVMLAGVNLRKARLRGINLQEAELSETYLSDADLEAANLEKANLHEARLRYTILKEAILTKANLQGAYLHHANLKNANLCEAVLSGADLKEADLEGANLTGVIGITAEQLSRVKSLKAAILPTEFTYLQLPAKRYEYNLAVLNEPDE